MQWEYKITHSKIKSKGFVSPAKDANSLELHGKSPEATTLHKLGRQTGNGLVAPDLQLLIGAALLFKLYLTSQEDNRV